MIFILYKVSITTATSLYLRTEKESVAHMLGWLKYDEAIILIAYYYYDKRFNGSDALSATLLGHI